MSFEQHRRDDFGAVGWVSSLMRATVPTDLVGPTPCAEFDVRRLIGHLIGTAKRGLATAERAPSHEAARGFTIETITHGWDFAVAIGQPSDVCDDAAQFCLSFVDDVVRARLRLVMYNEPVRIPATASATGHLAAVLGRQEASKTVPG